MILTEGCPEPSPYLLRGGHLDQLLCLSRDVPPVCVLVHFVQAARWPQPSDGTRVVVEGFLALFDELAALWHGYGDGAHPSSSRKPLLLKGPVGPLSGELHSANYFHGLDGLS